MIKRFLGDYGIGIGIGNVSIIVWFEKMDVNTKQWRFGMKF